MRAFTLVAFQASLLLAALQCAAAYVPNMPVTHARSGLVRLREPFAAPDPALAMDDALILLDNNIATPPLWMRCLAESAGTSFLVLGFSLISSLGLSLAASSMAIGLVIATAVSALASVSGAHFNPAITCALTAAGDLRPLDASAYVCSQCAGAFLAAGLASLLAGVSVPTAPATFGNEAALTAALVFGCLGIGDWVARGLVTARESPALVGSWICALSIAFTQRLGAGLNPAISFGMRAAAAAAGAPGGRLLLAGASSFVLAPLLGGLGGAGLLAAWLGHGTGCFTTVAKLPSKLYSRDLSNGLLRVGVPTRRAVEAASAASTAETVTALSSVQRLVGGDTRRVKAAMDP